MYELSQRQEILRDDIRGLIKGEVRCDDITQQIYSTDSGILQCRPAAVVYPRCIEDISSLVRFASEKHIPVHARGAGTGRSGESLGSGIVIDFTRFMKKITLLDYEHVAVQPGISRSRLNYTLYRTEKRYFAPTGISPASTIGSILARNGAGVYYLRDGSPAEHLLGMTVVLANGNVMTLNRNNLLPALDTNLRNKRHRRILTEHNSASDFETISVARGLALARGIVNGEEYALADNVHRILTASASGGLTPAVRPPLPKVSRAGYCTEGILNGDDGHSVDLTPLIQGSEGTLALLVEAKLRTAPLPQRQCAAILFFEQLETAAQSVEIILKYNPALCELLDCRRLKMLRKVSPKYLRLLPVESEAAVLVELNGGTDIQERLNSLLDGLQNKYRLCFHSVKINEPEMFLLFDRLLDDSELILYRTERPFQSIPLFDDTAVEPQYLPQYINDVLKAVQRCGIICSLSGHIGQGHLRINPFINFAAEDYAGSLRRLSEEVYSVVRQHHGTVSSEGAAGFLKTQFLPEQFGEHFAVFRQIKNLFDPENILNPGKVIPDSAQPQKAERIQMQKSETASHPADWTQYLRSVKYEPETITPGEQLRVQLKWEPERFYETVYRCTNCGNCLRTEPDRTMRTCPLYRRFTDEDAAPRSKCNLLRGVLDKDIVQHIDINCLTARRAKEVADRCIQCGMCLTECPAEVDVAHTAFRIKSAYNAAHGLSVDDWMLANSDTVLQYFAAASYPVNWALKNKIVRWLLEKMFHIPQNRVIPPVSKLTFLNRSRFQTWLPGPKEKLPEYGQDSSEPKLKVALLIDSYVNFFAPELADAAVKILEHNGIEVFVPPKQKSSGLTAFLTGHSMRAEYLARYNTLLLSDLIRQGYHTVALEPASAACIANNYRYVCEGINTVLVSANIIDFCTFLYNLHRQGKLKMDFKPLRAAAGYHAPCRLIGMTVKNIDVPVPAEELLRLIPQLEVRRIERGCCGMSVIYGLKQQNHRHSLQIGLPLFRALKSDALDFGVSDCNSCLLQMRHGVPEKEMLHPVKLLAAAYGFK